MRRRRLLRRSCRFVLRCEQVQREEIRKRGLPRPRRRQGELQKLNRLKLRNQSGVPLGRRVNYRRSQSSSRAQRARPRRRERRRGRKQRRKLFLRPENQGRPERRLEVRNRLRPRPGETGTTNTARRCGGDDRTHRVTCSPIAPSLSQPPPGAWVLRRLKNSRYTRGA